MSFHRSFYDYLSSHTLTGIKGGTQRDNFLQIWMVEVNSRVFARSWSKSARSWFTSFIQEGRGQIQFGENVIDVRGVKVDPGDPIQSEINEAYLSKYTQEGNVEYAEGIVKPEYANFTMEFLPL